MRRAWIVARHEFLTQLRRRSFLFLIFVFPLLIGGIGILATMLAAPDDEDANKLGQIGVVDQSGVLAAGRERPDNYVSFASQEEAARALSSGDVGGYFVVASDYMASGKVEAYAAEPIGPIIESEFRDYLLANLLSHRSSQDLARLRDPAMIGMATLDGRLNVDEETGMFMIMMPIFFAVIFVMTISMTASTLMQNVVEEKETRMVEVIVTSITPLQLLAGKILALFALGLLQIVVWALAGAVVLALRPNILQNLQGLNYPGWLLALGVLYLFLGYLLYGTLLGGVGAASNSMQEAQPIAGIVSILGVAPLFVLTQFLENPNGSLPTFLSLLPFTAPTAMMVRAVLGEVPWWQIGLSLALLAVTAALALWLAAWVFRVGLLMTGKPLTPRALWRAIQQNGAIPDVVHDAGRSS